MKNNLLDNFLYLGKTLVPYRYHMGHTLNGRPCEDRWRKDPSYSKLPYFPEKVAEYNIGDKLDWDIRPYVLQDPYITAPKDEGEDIRSPEIYDVDKCIENPDKYFSDVIIKSIEKAVKKGACEIKGRYIPRTLQTAVSVEVISRWNGNTIIQPLDLCPRFGKDFTHLDIFERSKFKVMVIASYWLGSNESLIKTVNERLDISADIEVIKPDYDLYVKALSEGKRVLIDVSLHVDSDKIDGRLLDAFKQEDALIVVDEADFGAWTSISRSILQQYTECGNNLVLLSTGSNIERAMIGAKGDIQNPIRYTYADLIALKKQGDETYKELVEVTCYNLDATQAFIDEQNNMSPEDRLNMKKLFAKRNTHVQREFKKQVLFDKERGNDVFGIYSRHWGQIDHPVVMVWCNTEKLDLDSLARVCSDPDYNIFVLHSNKSTNRSAEKDVKESIKQAEKEGKEGTVIFSCSMGARSFSIPNIIATVDCFDGGSLAAATQRASRCLTPGCGKEMGLVVNYTFNPNRSSKFETDLISSEINKDGDTDSAVRRIHGVINTLKDRDTFMTEKDFREYITSDHNIRNMASSSINYSEMYDNIELRELLDDVKGQKDRTKKVGLIDDAKTYMDSENNEKTKKEIDGENKKLQDFRSKIVRILNSAGNIPYLAPDCKSFEKGLEIISKNNDKNRAYKSLAGLNALIVLDKFSPYFNKTYMDLLVSKNINSGTYDKFDYVTCEHPSNIFDDELNHLKKNVIYYAKEPSKGVLSDLEKISKINNLVVGACEPGYVDYYKSLGYNTTGVDAESYSLIKMGLNPKNTNIIGNFPFQGNSKAKRWVAWHKFLESSIKLGNRVCVVIPASVIAPGNPWQSIRKNLIKLDLTVGEKFKGVGSTFCRITWDKNYTGTTEIVTPEKTYHIDVSGYDFLPLTINDHTLSLYDYFKKGTREWKRTTEFHTSKISKWLDDDGSIEVFHTNKQSFKTSTYHPNNEKIRVGVSLSGYPKFKVMHNMAGGQVIAWTECSSIEEANELADNLNTEEIQKVVKAFKWSGWNSIEVIKLLS